MSDNISMALANDCAVIYKISHCIYQALLEIQYQPSELLRKKYREVPWHDISSQAVFMMKLKEGFSKTQDNYALT